MMTVIFSSHNGERTLPRMFEALCHMEKPEGGWKLIAVDNASTDRTQQIMTEWRDRLPMEIMFHGRKGKSAALNVALERAEGELVVLTDDDIIPCSSWLKALYITAQRQPDYDLFGGSIEPVWPYPPPDWLLKYVPLGICYAMTSPRAEGPMKAGLIWGGNMMFRARIFQSGHRFLESIGPVGSESYIMGGETEFTSRLEAQGYKAWFASEAQVGHIVRPEQMQRDWILSRAVRFGKTLAFKESELLQRDGIPFVLGAPRWMYRALVIHWLHSLVAGSPFKTGRSIASAWQVYMLWGRIGQHRALQRKMYAQDTSK